MNWYKQSKLKEASIMGTIARLFAVGLAHVAVIAFLMKNYNISEEQAQNFVNQYESTQTEAQPAAIQEPERSQQNETTIESAEDMIKRHEGFEPYAYDDTRGIRTIGYGFNLERADARQKIESLGLDYDSVYRGDTGITENQAESLFEDAYREAVVTANSFAPNFSSLPETAQNILVDMSYNLGPKIHSFEKMQEAIADSDWGRAADEMIDSKWYNQVGNRSRELERMMRSLD